MSPRQRLETLLAPEFVAALEELIAERVAEALADYAAADNGPRWLPVAEAARREGCTTDAMRMRLARGRYETKRVGRSVLVSAASLDGRVDRRP